MRPVRSANRHWLPVLGLAVVGLAATALKLQADLPAVQAAGRLRVIVVEDGNRHFLSTSPGSDPGFDREILDGFARLHRVQVELVPVATWSDLVPALLANRGDLIAGNVTDTPSRREHIAFTVEVFPTRNVVVTRKPHPPVTTLAQLRRERVGTIRGTSLASVTASLGLPAGSVDDSLSSRQGALAEALRRGQVTAVVNGIEVALKDVERDPELQIGMFVGVPESLAFGVRKDDRLLLAALDVYIDGLRRSPVWSRLVVKYFGASALDVLRRARAP